MSTKTRERLYNDPFDIKDKNEERGEVKNTIITLGKSKVIDHMRAKKLKS